jgi:hypothetical protein
MPYTDSYEAIKVFRPSNRNQLRSRHWKDPVWIGNKIDHTLVNPNHCDHIRLLSRTRPPQTFRLKATTSFTFIVLWHHCQETHRDLDTPRTEHVQAYCTIRLGSTERSVSQKPRVLWRRKFPGHRFGEHKVAATTTVAMNHQSHQWLRRVIASRRDSR